MNKNTLVIIAVIVILALLGGGAYLMMNKNSGNASASVVSDANVQPTSSSGSTSLKSLKDLFLSGVPQKCTFTENNNNNVNVVGTTYTASGKMRGDITSTVEGKNIVTHMLVANNTSYVWMEDQKTGFKMSFDPTAQPTPGQNQGLDMNKSMNFSCNPWPADNSLFDVPAGVQFSDFGKMTVPSGMKVPAGQTEVTPGQGAVSCSACDNLPEAAKAQCRSALKCS